MQTRVSTQGSDVPHGGVRRIVLSALLLSTWVIGAVVLPAAPVQAQALNVQALEASPFGQDLVTVGKGFSRSQWQWNAGLLIDFQDDPLVLRGIRRDVELRKVVSGQLSLHVLGSVALADFLDVGLVLPVVAWQDGQGLPGEAAPESYGVGDLRLHVRLMMYRTPDRRFSIAMTPVLTFPTGREVDRYMGSSTATITPWITTGLEWPRGGVALNVGYRPLPRTQVLDLDLRDQVLWRVGGWGGLVAGRLDLIAEVSGAVGLASPWSDARQRPVELLAALRFRPTCRVDLTAGGSAGLTKGWASPDWRLFLGFGVGSCEAAPEGDQAAAARAAREAASAAPVEIAAAPPPPPAPPPLDLDALIASDPDPDRDGVDREDDRCPDEPEDPDGFQDDDGCPDPDNDGDGVPDETDGCRDQAEVVNGVADEDGCPDEGEARVTLQGGVIELKDRVFFETGSDVLKVESHDLLRQVAALLKAHLGVRRVRVDGHTDDVGDREQNVDLSERRARRVVQFLIAAGVEASRLEAKGFGSTVPLDPAQTAEARARNRRVEFTVVPEGPGEARP